LLMTGVKEVQYAAVKAGFAEARALLEQARPDAIVIFSTDHFDRCFFMTTYKGNEVITKYARAPELEQVAGNGEQEVRDWRAVAGGDASASETTRTERGTSAWLWRRGDGVGRRLRLTKARKHSKNAVAIVEECTAGYRPPRILMVACAAGAHRDGQ